MSWSRSLRRGVNDADWTASASEKSAGLRAVMGGQRTYCSTSMGAPLDAESCPINKPIPIYAEEPDGCPETH